MADLQTLKAAADAAWNIFQKTLEPAGYRDCWEFYKAADAKTANQTVLDLHDDYLKKIHAFYHARDGERGFLGSRGQ